MLFYMKEFVLIYPILYTLSMIILPHNDVNCNVNNQHLWYDFVN